MTLRRKLSAWLRLRRRMDSLDETQVVQHHRLARLEDEVEDLRRGFGELKVLLTMKSPSPQEIAFYRADHDLLAQRLSAVEARLPKPRARKVRK